MMYGEGLLSLKMECYYCNSENIEYDPKLKKFNCKQCNKSFMSWDLFKEIDY